MIRPLWIADSANMQSSSQETLERSPPTLPPKAGYGDTQSSSRWNHTAECVVVILGVRGAVAGPVRARCT